MGHVSARSGVGPLNARFSPPWMKCSRMAISSITYGRSRLGRSSGCVAVVAWEVLLEPLEALVPLLIVGGGHVSTACAPLLAKVGFVGDGLAMRAKRGERRGGSKASRASSASTTTSGVTCRRTAQCW